MLFLNAGIPVLHVTHQERGHLGREGLGSEVTWFMADIIILLSRYWHLFRKYWLDGEKLSFLCGTIHPSWDFHAEMYWSKWQAKKVDSDSKETANSPTSSPYPAFRIALSHAKHPMRHRQCSYKWKISLVLSLALWVSAIHSSPFSAASDVTITYTQDCLCLAVDLLSQGITPLFLLSIA